MADQRNTGQRRRNLPELRPAAVDAATLLADLRGARGGDVKMQRQEEYRNEQKDIDPAPASGAVRRNLGPFHDS